MQLSSLLGHTQEVLSRIRASSKPADSLIDSFFRSHKYLGSHDRRFIAETVYGTLRHLRKCEFILRQSLGSESIEVKNEDGLLLLIATYLIGVAKQSISSAEIVPRVNSPHLKKKLSVLLKNLSADYPLPKANDVETIGIQHSFPDWMVERFVNEYGREETERICQSLNEPAPLTLRANTLKTTVEQCKASLAQEGVEAQRTRLSPDGLQITKRLNVFSLKSFQDGLFEVQDEGSQLLPLLIDPKPTTRLLDACAGAGGKTLAFAAIMQNRGEIYATDTNEYRLRELKKRARRAGAFNVRPMLVANLSDLAENHSSSFDTVFVDAPCSGLGTIRRNPGMKWTVTEVTIDEVCEKQLGILKQCAPLVKPGGRLIYATCTLLRQENEDVVDSFMAESQGFNLMLPETMLAKFGISRPASDKFVKFLPHIHGTDGFFAAFLVKSK